MTILFFIIGACLLVLLGVIIGVGLKGVVINVNHSGEPAVRQETIRIPKIEMDGLTPEEQEARTKPFVPRDERGRPI